MSGQNKTPANPFVAESIAQHAEQVADITTRMAEPAAEIAEAYRPGTAQTVDETHPAVGIALAAVGARAAADIEEAKIGEPVDLGVEVEVTVTGGSATDPEPEADVTEAEFDAMLSEAKGSDPDDEIRASREYGDLLERGYQDREALVELKARTEAAQ